MTLPFYSASPRVALKRFFKGYAQFRGRASKSEYWWPHLLVGSIASFLGAVTGICTAVAPEQLDGTALIVVMVPFGVTIMFSLAVALPSLALGWRRLQDANVHGAFTFITFFTSVWPVVIGLLPTNYEGQRYDHPPAFQPYPLPPSDEVVAPGYAYPAPPVRSAPRLCGTDDPDDMSLPFYSVSSQVALKRFFLGYARFAGRASKSEFWWVQLFAVLTGLVLTAAMTVVWNISPGGRSVAWTVSCAVTALVALVWLLPWPALAWRRLHDTDKAGWAMAAVVALALGVPLLVVGWRQYQAGAVPGALALAALAAGVCSLVVGSLPTETDEQAVDDLGET